VQPVNNLQRQPLIVPPVQLDSTKTEPIHLPSHVNTALLVNFFSMQLPTQLCTFIPTNVFSASKVLNQHNAPPIAAFVLKEPHKIKTTTTPPFVSIVRLGNIY
jgi:hypothetical protein